MEFLKWNQHWSKKSTHYLFSWINCNNKMYNCNKIWRVLFKIMLLNYSKNKLCFNNMKKLKLERNELLKNYVNFTKRWILRIALPLVSYQILCNNTMIYSNKILNCRTKFNSYLILPSFKRIKCDYWVSLMLTLKVSF